MSSEKHAPALIAGLNKSKKFILAGQASKAYIATDADAALIDMMTELCRDNGVSVEVSKTKTELMELCGIEVGCAVCVVPKSI